ncbi:alpha/beta hydrolase-fold protein [Chryseobacterium herbae]|uniref:Alpha/beta hydrolase-fold protein n=1 Tax=Chryseobacterium herbae TaxID=2976476 RepID=A0ABT2IPK5_9FLAO|nr:alpha/beta hydrolase-fold protein [Chryseobacterium sp. pc1-10]MCT2560615.1 alpha/beta hydrolase-fold protein [Chryseobacterium sp. pc1-10]
MRYYLTLSLFLVCLLVNGQENYSTLTQKALETMWKAKDETGYQKSLDMYEEAFKIYPDSIDGTGLYKASVLASELKNTDKAFKYLTPLAKMKADEDGYPGWGYVIGESSNGEYKNLLNDPRWKTLVQGAVRDKELFYKDLKEIQDEFFRTKDYSFDEKENAAVLYSKIKNSYPYLPKKQQNYSVLFKVNDSTNTSYLVHLPKDYDPGNKYPVLFFLHGAVRNNVLTDYQMPAENLGGWNRFYTKYADLNHVILVFPKGGKKYNWMTPDDGFFMIPEMLKQIKKTINVDDNKVFISGHSNGATGSFSYLMKQPGPFAGFYGFNTFPKVFTGGTFIENIKNRSFINFSTDQDYYYPPNANDDFTKLMKEIKGDYKEQRNNGFPHWFPQFDESEPAVQTVFNDLKSRKRNPFPKEITWEYDDNNYGNMDWISDMKLDTLQSKAQWHQALNFKITKWLKYDKNDSLITENVNKNAFDFPRKSGKIKAVYTENIFKIKTSCIQSFSLNISPEMINPDKKLKVFINGKLYFNGKIEYDRKLMLRNFENNRDREQIWISSLHFKV